MSETYELSLRCHLNDIQGIGIVTQLNILNTFQSIEHFLDSDVSLWESCGIKEKSVSSLLNLKQRFEQKKLASHPALSNDPNILFTSYGFSNYPSIFYTLKDPPFLLYLKGNRDLLTYTRKLGVVGTRQPSEAGKEFTRGLSSYCSQHHIITISGGAPGIDTEVHKSTIVSKGKTICILGMPIEQYPKNFTEYYVRNDALILSEFPSHIKAEPFFFIKRNRLISFLSDALVVVEAGEKSGALITAQYAKNQSKPLLAVPGSPFQLKSVGTNNLIKSGAYCFTQFDELKQFFKEAENKTSGNLADEQKSAPRSLEIHTQKTTVFDEKPIPQTFRQVYDCLSVQPKNVEEIAQISKQPTSLILEHLTMLELDGHIASLPGGLYLRR